MKKYLHIIKIIAAFILLCAPCALHFIFLDARLSGDELLYSYSGALWVLTPLSGIAACIALRGENEAEIDDEEFDDSYDAPDEGAVVDGETYIEEYSELYRTENAGEELAASCAPDIAAAISAQKAVAEDDTVSNDGRDSAWEEFVGDISEEKSYADIYDNIPDTLPEGFSFDEEEEDADDAEEEESAFEAPVTRVPVLRIAAAAVCAVCIVLGAVLSGSYVAPSDGGVAVKGKNYSWSNVEQIEISPAALGDGLRVVALMSDGKKATVCSDSMFAGDAAKDLRGDIEVYAHICELAKAGGAGVYVRDRKSIEASFGDSEDWELVSEMIDGN